MLSAILRSRLRRYKKSDDSLDGFIKIYYAIIIIIIIIHAFSNAPTSNGEERITGAGGRSIMS